jgi:hypothetical protein
MYSAAGTFLALILHLIYDIATSPSPAAYWKMSTVSIIIDYFIIAVSIIVVAVP